MRTKTKIYKPVLYPVYVHGNFREMPISMLDFTVSDLDGPPGNQGRYEIEMPLCLN